MMGLFLKVVETAIKCSMRGILKILLYSSILILSLINEENSKALDNSFLSQIKTNTSDKIQSTVLKDNVNADLKNASIIRFRHSVGEQRSL